MSCLFHAIFKLIEKLSTKISSSDDEIEKINSEKLYEELNVKVFIEKFSTIITNLFEYLDRRNP